MNIDAIRDGIVTRLQTITAIASRSYPRVPDNIDPPCAFVGMVSGTYGDTFDGLSTVNAEVFVVVGPRADSVRSQGNLDDYLNTTGSKSVVAALEADPDLAGAAHSLRVQGWEQYTGNLVIADLAYTGVRFTVEVYAG